MADGTTETLRTAVGTTRQVFLFCSPTALVLWLAFGATHLWTLFMVLVVLSVYVTGWRLAREERDPELAETVFVAWFYNLAVSGAAVLGTQYGVPGTVFIVGLPAVAAVVRGRVLAS